MPRVLTALLVLTVLAGPSELHAQSHFTDCKSLTGSNATLLIPSSASITVDGNFLPTSSEIAVFTQDGLCAGVVVWRGESTGFPVWADDSQSEEKDGFVAGEALSYRVWDAADNVEYGGDSVAIEATFSDAQPFYSTDNTYTEDGIYEITSFSVETGPVGNEEPQLPSVFTVHPNYPNPFNPSTNINFELPGRTHVRVTVYNVAGARVDEILNEEMAGGSHTLRWEAGNLSSGTYFCRVQAGGDSKMQTMVLLK